jgi:hypothetical protein
MAFADADLINCDSAQVLEPWAFEALLQISLLNVLNPSFWALK